MRMGFSSALSDLLDAESRPDGLSPKSEVVSSFLDKARAALNGQSPTSSIILEVTEGLACLQAAGLVEANAGLAEVACSLEKQNDAHLHRLIRDLSGSSLYCIGERWGGRVKVGISKNVRRRLMQLRTGNPENIYLLGFQQNRPGLEASIHEVLRTFRMSGEWFDDGLGYVRYTFDKAEKSHSENRRWLSHQLAPDSAAPEEDERDPFLDAFAMKLNASLRVLSAQEEIASANEILQGLVVRKGGEA